MVFLDFEGRFNCVPHERTLILRDALLSDLHRVELLRSSYARRLYSSVVLFAALICESSGPVGVHVSHLETFTFPPRLFQYDIRS